MVAKALLQLLSMSMRYVPDPIMALLIEPQLLQATEDNEMNLVEGEYIEQIEEIDDGWWSGVGPGGKTGLFPCKPV